MEARTRPVRFKAVNKVVARYADGKIVKGSSMNVDPAKPTINVVLPAGESALVPLAELKALFFVKSLDGNASHQEAMNAAPSDPRARGSHLIELRFRDGERLVAFANRYPPIGSFFFVVPVDTASNNIRILINRAQVVSMDKANVAA